MGFQEPNQLDLAIAQTLKDKRKENGWGMKQLARKLDVPHSFIGKVESGERKLSIGEFDSYCLSLNTTLNDIFKMCCK
jgi:transcriptional regulator with XRE-family HTH domain